jgi:phosphoribosylformylglycinamidine synthase
MLMTCQSTAEKVEQLLPFSPTSEAILKNPGSLTRTYYITPRNISPWSSKATSIAHVCGLRSQVQRIERGRAVLINFTEDPGEEIPLHSLYDRMTEIISTAEPSVEKMFAEGQRYPLEIVDLSADEVAPIEVLKAYNIKRGLALDLPE